MASCKPVPNAPVIGRYRSTYEVNLQHKRHGLKMHHAPVICCAGQDRANSPTGGYALSGRRIRTANHGRVCVLLATQRRKAYQVDLRWNIIFSIVARGRSVIEAAREFGVACTTAFNYWSRFRNSADLSVTLRSHQRIERALDELSVVFLLTLFALSINQLFTCLK